MIKLAHTKKKVKVAPPLPSGIHKVSINLIKEAADDLAIKFLNNNGYYYFYIPMDGKLPTTLGNLMAIAGKDPGEGYSITPLIGAEYTITIKAGVLTKISKG